MAPNSNEIDDHSYHKQGFINSLTTPDILFQSNDLAFDLIIDSNKSLFPYNDTSNISTVPTDTVLEVVIPFTIVYGIIFLTGVIGNISTCIVIAKNKSMHTATNYYLFSLAISDMVLLVSGLPPEMYRIWSPGTYIFGPVICFLQGFSAETSANATVLTITAFTVERYLAICHPFLSHTMSKLSRCVRIIIIIWIVALTLAIPQAIQFGIDPKNGNDCTVVEKIFNYAFEVSTIVFFIAPMTLITVLYILIGRQLKKSTAKRPSLTQNSSNSTATGYSFHHNSEAAKKRLRHTLAQNKVVRMLIAVVAAFFICWAPFHAQRLMAIHLMESSSEAQKTYYQLYQYLMYISGVLYYLSTCINPLLYHLMSNKYRNAFRKTFHNVFSRRKNHTRNYTATAVRLTTTKLPDNFLGETPHPALTADARTSSKTSSKLSRLSPQTSQTSFSSSKIEASQVLIHGKIPIIKYEPSPGQSCGSLKSRFLRLFKSSLGTNYITQNRLDKGIDSISNSSLKDTDDMDMVCADLVKHMKQVNELL